jgi:hypothetical protein
MSVGVAEGQVTIKNKIKLQSGQAIYLGTISFGTEYATGGDSIGESAESKERWGALPSKWEFISIEGAYSFEYVPSTNKIKAYGTGAAAKGIGVEAEATKPPGTGLPFIGIGDA